MFRLKGAKLALTLYGHCTSKTALTLLGPTQRVQEAALGKGKQ